MSLNDFEKFDLEADLDAEVLDMSNVMSKRKVVDAAIVDAYDAATEIGFKLGALDERARILEIVDAFIENISDEKENPKKTLAILKESVIQSVNDQQHRSTDGLDEPGI